MKLPDVGIFAPEIILQCFEREVLPDFLPVPKHIANRFFLVVHSDRPGRGLDFIDPNTIESYWVVEEPDW